MSKFVVSANYKDRSSEYKWLVRKAGGAPDTAKECKSLLCQGVVFKDSGDYESGFGCGRVAFCDNVVLPSKGNAELKLAGTESALGFHGYDFRDSLGRDVNGCDLLLLGSDGKMVSLGNHLTGGSEENVDVDFDDDDEDN